MKNLSFLMIASFASLIFFSSCSSDSDCHECHLAYPLTDSTGTVVGERAFDISNASGGDEFCGDELTDVENPANAFEVTEMLISDDGNDTLMPGTYGNGDGWEVHCEEHGAHDDH
tara:strand:- start:113 stop:457 length:345 start_codon:yes stop_codon:yes gene_type:complete